MLLLYLAALVLPGAGFAADRTLAVNKASPASEHRVALVIGNGSYVASPLRNPVNDARAVAQNLKDLGFQVILRENLGQRGMVEALRTFGTLLKEDGVGLFFFAGHGMQVRGRNFLIPVDADIQSEDEVAYLSLDANQVLDKMDRARSRVNLVILDACRNNPFVRSFRSAAAGLAQMEAPSGTLIAFATAPGSVASDGEGKNGLYTKHLLANLATPGLPVEIMFKRVREGVTRETADRQTPWESSSLKGDFFFKLATMDAEGDRKRQQAAIDQAVSDAVRRAHEQAAAERAAIERRAQEQAERMIRDALERQKAILEQERLAREQAQQAAQANRPVDAAAIELAFWDSIKNSNRAGDFQAYLRKYPAGQFAELARIRIESLAPAVQAPPGDKPAAAPRPQPTTAASSLPAKPQASVAVPGGPVAGNRFTYRYTDEYKPDLHKELKVEVVAVSEAGILDRMRVQGSVADEWGFSPEMAVRRRMAGGISLPDFAPYLSMIADLKPGEEFALHDYSPDDGSVHPVKLRGRVEARRERITVPAGTFEATRIELKGTQPGSGSTRAREYRLTYWYAPDIPRYIKLKVDISSPGPGRGPDRDVFELLSFVADRQAPTLLAASAASVALTGLPGVGSSWKYRHVDGWSNRTQMIEHQISERMDQDLVEQISIAGKPAVEQGFPLGSNMVIYKTGGLYRQELSPYWPALLRQEAGNAVATSPPVVGPDSVSPWIFEIRIQGRQAITVPAGSFDAIHVVVEGKRSLSTGEANYISNRVRHELWYAPAIKRHVKQQSSYWGNREQDRDLFELVDYTLK